jgi:hypothetical protein
MAWVDNREGRYFTLKREEMVATGEGPAFLHPRSEGALVPTPPTVQGREFQVLCPSVVAKAEYHTTIGLDHLIRKSR